MTDNEAPQNIGDTATTDAAGLDEETIRARAYEISQRPDAGSAEENWHRAIDELRSERRPE